jgi:hypothetical protein
MRTKKNKKTTMPDQEGIDRLVISQADDESAWEAPIRVKRSRPDEQVSDEVGQPFRLRTRFPAGSAGRKAGLRL